jgi:hypothetical protein
MMIECLDFFWFLVCGVWCMIYDLWFMVYPAALDVSEEPLPLVSGLWV